MLSVPGVGTLVATTIVATIGNGSAFRRGRASAEETKRMKPTDKAILGMVSESSGRNVSEPSSGLVKILFEGRVRWFGTKTAWHVADWLTRRVTSAGW
ncbi:MAG TPA: hypothetical protein VH437_19535 [Terriglobales bacterium]